MPLTSPDGIYYADTSTADSVATISATEATSVQNALSNNRAQRNFKWPNTGARNAQAGMVINDRGYQSDTGVIYRFNGVAWKAWESDWANFTPTITNIAIGTGGSATNSAMWKYEEGRVRQQGIITLGTTTFSVTGSITVSLNITALPTRHPYQGYSGLATMWDVSAAFNYFAFVCAANASTTSVQILSPGTNGLRVGSTASVPFTWAAGDSVSYDFSYDPA